jgi:hypothetical protein
MRVPSMTSSRMASAAAAAPTMVPRLLAIRDNRVLGAALVLGLALVGTTAWLGATSLKLDSAIDFLLALYLFAVSAIIVGALALSPFDAMTRGGLLIASLILLIFAGAFWLLRGRPSAPSLRRALGAGMEAVRDPVVAVLAVAVGGALAYSTALAVATTETSFDANWYHLARAAFWRQQHAVGYISHANNPRLNVFPPGAEIVSSWTMTLNGGGRFASLFQIVALIATMLAIAGIGRRAGLDHRAAAFGALLFASLPVVALQAPAALNDIAVASFVVIAVYFLLSNARGALGLGALALALAIATKVTALLALPLLAVLAVALSPRRRWPSIAVAGAAGIVVGGLWYVLNLVEKGQLIPTVDPGRTSHSHASAAIKIPAQLARLAIDAVDSSGSVGRDRYLYTVAAAVLLVLGAQSAVRRGSRAAAVGAICAAGVVLVPLAFPAAYDFLLRAYQHVLVDRRQEALAFLAWGRDPTHPSAEQSWYGPLGLLAFLAAFPLAVREIRRGALGAGALSLLLAPVLITVTIAAVIGYSEFHGRYLMAAVALAASTWGLLLRVRPLAVAATAIATVTLALVVVHNDEKPAGFSVLGGKSPASTWTMSRDEALAKAMGGAAGSLLAFDRRAADGATVGLRIGPFYISYPYFGADLHHRVVFIGDSGEGLSRHVDWLVVAPGLKVNTCTAGWQEVPSERAGWQLYRRVGACPGESASS